MIDLATPIKSLQVGTRGAPAGVLRRRSQFEFEYAPGTPRPVSLIMPTSDRRFSDGDLFAVMDMNLPEGFLLARLRERAPKTPPTKMQLLALMGRNGIGWLEYSRETQPQNAKGRGVSRAALLREGVGRGGKRFLALVDAYLETGAGLSGVQPKILVPERATIPVANLIVKAAGRDFPGLAANEFLCLEVARRARLEAAEHALSDDGGLLVIDRFDIGPHHARLGFEDIAALLDLRVGGALSDRKYRGSYEDVAEVVAQFSSQPEADLARLFDSIALSVLVRNGDAHLKNFALLYDEGRRWLAPIFDVVTTTLYRQQRVDGRRTTDRTLALKLRRGDSDKSYPAAGRLLEFAAEVCRVEDGRARVERIAQAMRDTLRAHRSDERLSAVRAGIEKEWESSLADWR